MKKKGKSYKKAPAYKSYAGNTIISSNRKHDEQRRIFHIFAIVLLWLVSVGAILLVALNVYKHVVPSEH